MEMYTIYERPYKLKLAGPLPSPDDFFGGLLPPVTAELHYQDPATPGERKYGGRLKNLQHIQDRAPFFAISYPHYVLVLRNLLSSPALRRSFYPLKDQLADRALAPFLHLAATLSQAGGTIGYHLDNYHVFIVQLSGSRTWHLWDKQVVSPAEQAYFIRENPQEVPTIKLSRPAPPDYTFTLEQGEALFIPALFPHEGITTGNEAPSLSLSYVWTALSGYTLLRPFLDSLTPPVARQLTEAHPEAFYTILHQLPAAPHHWEQWLESTLRDRLAILRADPAPSLEELLSYWRRAFRR